jgi:long-chain acyl-CoA synthetase
LIETIPQLLLDAVNKHPEVAAQMSKNAQGQFQTTSYKTLYSEVETLAAGLKSLGVGPGTKVGLISDNRKEWLISDLAILGLGGIDVPRGRDTMENELQFILAKTAVTIAMVENQEQLEKVFAVHKGLKLKHIVILDRTWDKSAGGKIPSGLKVHSFDEILALGEKEKAKDPEFFTQSLAAVKPNDLATIIFTSGTTGEPKGVMISHKNFTHQLQAVPLVIDVNPGEVWLSVLPVWHSFERIAEYIAMFTGSTLAYSKPIGKIMLADMHAVRPHWMASVPRIWEAVKAGVYRNVEEKGGISKVLFNFFVAVGKAYTGLKNMFTGAAPRFKKRLRILDILLSFLPLVILWPWQILGKVLVFGKITSRLGGRFRAGVSGGGSLPVSVERFFAAAGITLMNGYGLTETSPVIAIRNYFKPVAETLAVLPGTEIKILDEEGKTCPPGKKGTIYARGLQIMQGYFENPEATKKIIDPEGWLNTGDLGVWTHRGNFAIVGRAKDTIVLFGGENIEPVPIESKLLESELIEQVMVVGQDQKFLGAIIVPNLKELERRMKKAGIPYVLRSGISGMPEVQDMVGEEISNLINQKNGFRPFERIIRFALIEKSFELGKELSAKQEIKRHVIAEKYKDTLDKLFA